MHKTILAGLLLATSAMAQDYRPPPDRYDTPQRYDAPPAYEPRSYDQPPGYAAPPPGYNTPQPGYGNAGPGYGSPPPGYNAPRDYDRRDDPRAAGNEPVYQARVTDVRAVLGDSPDQRCWVEREQYVKEEQQRGGPNVAGAVVGAVIGGVLGHQVGGGRGKDIATAGGAVAGGALGANVGRGEGGPSYDTRDVQRCRTIQGNSRPAYWDVTYRFRGEEHHAQFSEPPGDTISVNRDGEPRV